MNLETLLVVLAVVVAAVFNVVLPWLKKLQEDGLAGWQIRARTAEGNDSAGARVFGSTGAGVWGTAPRAGKSYSATGACCGAPGKALTAGHSVGSALWNRARDGARTMPCAHAARVM